MQQLNGIDASFLYMETATMHFNVCYTVICDLNGDDAPAFAGIWSALSNRVREYPEFRRRLVEVPLALDHPWWIDDPDFDLAHHLHHIALPQPATMRTFEQLIGRLACGRLDRRYPLWQAWLIEGLPDGRFALFFKYHHALVDGVSGARLTLNACDPESGAGLRALPRAITGEPVPERAELVRIALQHLVRRPEKLLRVVRDSVRGVVALLRTERQLQTHQAGSDHVRAAPYRAPQTLFNHQLSARRDYAQIILPMDRLRAIKAAAGVTLNDLVLAIVGGGLRRYLDEHGGIPEQSLIAMVPVSVRRPDEQEVRNRVSGMWATLATDIADPVERLQTIHADAQQAKTEHGAVGGEILEEWAEFNAPGFRLAIDLYRESGLTEVAPPVHNLIVSNIPGTPETRTLAGYPVEAICPIGPVMEGVGLNITLLSYGNTLGFGVYVDAEQVSDPERIGAAIEAEYREFARRLLPKSAQTGSGAGRRKKPAQSKPRARANTSTRKTRSAVPSRRSRKAASTLGQNPLDRLNARKD
ncbi:MAG: wax ester/triacylglycerol synthase family O-acyltransferase [Candidatus Dadabacteria bacterium]|nr:MAG: wax ester/triacylglycerol synthase family O-acyltransferase [Candidatus Dadabacteria bacterium]